MSSNDTKTQMRLSIKQHRHNLLQCLEGNGNTDSKPKIQSVSNAVEKSNLHYIVKPKIEIINHEPSIKKLSVQLLDETYNDELDDINDEDFEDSEDDNISVGNENEAIPTHNESDVDENDKRNLKTENQFYGQLDNDNKTYLDNNYSSGIPDVNVNNSTTRMRRRTRKNINYFEKPLETPRPKIDKYSLEWKAKKEVQKSIINAKEKIARDCLAKLFANLQKKCSYFNSSEKVEPKISILYHAKQECDMLRLTENRLCMEKQYFQEQGKILKKRLAEITES